MKFCWAVSEELRWQDKQDGRTDRRVKNIIPSPTHVWDIKMFHNCSFGKKVKPRKIMGNLTIWYFYKSIIEKGA